ncbi:hypothetical protein CCZ01_00065 [Helicobacter monodelphidis]|uniref:hypothetical protein n=1 Tax=Helicobacter sp. 15-1451 TaxID=2004995 RepID=UPI000DCDC2F0|nr:hypothetical protein [Helicobacter sp. 15-1451]RAX59179.1 hypothetical protein CCZ01_00065 [Helicobacter sp. 15-1451]
MNLWKFISLKGGFLLSIVLILGGCFVKEAPRALVQEIPYHILLITPEVRFADMGFVKQYENKVNLELYALGKALYKIEIEKSQICVQDSCYNKSLFIQKLFGDDVQDTILEEILIGKDIFNGKNKYMKNGITIQEFKDYGNVVLYIRDENKISFSDKKRKIRIVLESKM